MRRVWRSGWWWCVVGAAVLGGCQTTPAQPQHKSAFRQPQGIAPERVILGNEPLEDRDRNGYVDTVRVVVYVFGNEAEYPLPMTVDATFQFRLVGANGKSIGVWAFSPRDSARAVFATQPGPAYGFEISLIERGTDRMPAQGAALSCEVILEDGTRIKSREPLQIRIGGGGL